MTANPAHDDAIVDYIARINLKYGGATVEMVKTFIEGLGYKAPDRELRRLLEKGRLVRWTTGVYYAKKSMMAQGIGRFV